MNIINAETARNIKNATTITIELIEVIMQNPEEFILQGYWDISDVFNPESQQHIASLTVHEAAAMKNWIVSWLSAYGWELSEDNHIFAHKFD